LRPAQLAVLASALAGCVAFPPMRVGAGGGFTGQGAAVAPAAHLVANARPLALVSSLRDRSFDVSVGAFAQYESREELPYEHRFLAGPTTGVEGYPVRWPSADSVGRFVVGGELRALYHPASNSWGGFVVERVGMEIASYVEGCEVGGSSGGFGIGCGAGEGGIGIFAEVSEGYFDGSFRYSGVILVEVRIPAGFAGGIPFPK